MDLLVIRECSCATTNIFTLPMYICTYVYHVSNFTTRLQNLEKTMIVSCVFCEYVIQICVGRIHLLAIMCFFIFYTMIYMQMYDHYGPRVPEIKTFLFYNRQHVPSPLVGPCSQPLCK